MAKTPPPPPSKRTPGAKAAKTKTGPMGLVGKPPAEPAKEAAKPDATGPAPGLLDFLDRQAEAVTTGTIKTPGGDSAAAAAPGKTDETARQPPGPPASAAPAPDPASASSGDDEALSPIPGVTNRRPAWHWAVIASPVLILLIVLIAWPSRKHEDETDRAAASGEHGRAGQPAKASPQGTGESASPDDVSGSPSSERASASHSGTAGSASPDGTGGSASPASEGAAANPSAENAAGSPGSQNAAASPTSENGAASSSAQNAAASPSSESGAANPASPAGMAAGSHGAATSPSGAGTRAAANGDTAAGTATSSEPRGAGSAGDEPVRSQGPSVLQAPRVTSRNQPVPASSPAAQDPGAGMVAIACNRRCTVRLDGSMNAAAAGGGARVRAGRHVAIVTDAQTGYSITLRVDVPAGMLVQKRLTF